MNRSSYSPLVMLVLMLGASVALGQAPAKPATRGEPKTADFATAIKKSATPGCRSLTLGRPTKSRRYTLRRLY